MSDETEAKVAEIQALQTAHEQGGTFGSMERVRILAAKVPWLLELVAKLQTVTYCLYCGKQFLLDELPCPLCVDGPHDDHQEQSYEGTVAEQLPQHILICRQHPMWALQERVRELEAAQ